MTVILMNDELPNYLYMTLAIELSYLIGQPLFDRKMIDSNRAALLGIISGGSKGGAPGARPPRPKIFSISCSFSEKLAKSYVGAPLEGWRPLLQGILDPPLIIIMVQMFNLIR